LRYLIRENTAFLGYDPLTASPMISAGDVSLLADRDTMNARLAEDRAGDGYRGGSGRGVGDGGEGV